MRKSIALAALVLAMTLTPDAQAGTFTSSFENTVPVLGGSYGYNQSTVGELSLFDPTLGTLREVRLTLNSSTIGAFMEATAFNNIPPIYYVEYHYEFGINVDALVDSTSTIVENDHYGVFDLYVPEGESRHLDISSMVGPTTKVIIDAANLDEYKYFAGGSTTKSVKFGQFNEGLEYQLAGNPFYSVVNYGDLHIKFDVSYIYDATTNVVPEPASFAIWGLALSRMGLGLRRRRN